MGCGFNVGEAVDINIYHLYKSKFTSFAAPTMALAADGEDDEDDEAGAEESHPRYC